MTNYGYACVFWTQGGVTLYCTDPQMLESIFTELKKLVPSCKRAAEAFKLASGEVLGYSVHRLQGQDNLIFLWVVKQLCLQGWEPFEAKDLPLSPWAAIHLRKAN